MRRLLTTAGAATLIAILAFNDGGFDVSLRQQVWLVIWWGLALGLAFGAFPRAMPPAGWGVVAAALVAFCVLQTAAVIWAPSTELALADAARSAGYLGVLVLAWLGLGLRSWRAAAAGLLIASAAVTIWAVAGRLAPSLNGLTPEQLSFGTERLYAPLEYWNSMGVWAAATFAMALAWSADDRRVRVRAFSAALIPVAATALYLTFSRGGVVALAVGLGVVVGLTRNRRRALLHLLSGAIAAFFCVAAVRSQPAIAHGTSGDGGVAVGLTLILAAAAMWLVAAKTTVQIGRPPGAESPAPLSRTKAAMALCGLTVALLLVAIIGGRDGFGRGEIVVPVGADPAARLVIRGRRPDRVLAGSPRRPGGPAAAG